YVKNVGSVEVTGDGLALVSRDMAQKDASKRRFVPGAVVRVYQSNEQWQVTQLPEVESALVALDPRDGAVRALVGGFNFDHNKFNHVTQAWRQPGSSFKPFIYSAALEKGFTPATMIEDAPVYLS